LLFSDVVGSTALKQALGDRGGVALLQQHHEQVRQVLRDLAGAEVMKTAGDSFLMLFREAIQRPMGPEREGFLYKASAAGGWSSSRSMRVPSRSPNHRRAIRASDRPEAPQADSGTGQSQTQRVERPPLVNATPYRGASINNTKS
jgi:class 3 adenylate cyclase